MTQRGLAGFPNDTFINELQSRLSLTDHRRHELDKDSGLGSVVGSRESLNVTPEDDRQRSEVILSGGCEDCVVQPEHFCEDCKHSQCSKCFTNRGDHALHRTETVENLAQTHRTKMHEAIWTTRDEITSMRRGLSALDRYKVQLKSSRDDTLHQVHQRFEAIRMELDLAQKKMTSDIEVATLTDINRADMQRDHLKFNIATLENLSLMMHSFMNNSSNWQMM
jgi:hypothetical protein